MQSFNNLINTEKWKYGLIRKVTFLGGNLVVFSHVSVSKIWSVKRGGLLWEGPYKKGTNF
jgi:hypothetical protein